MSEEKEGGPSAGDDPPKEEQVRDSECASERTSERTSEREPEAAEETDASEEADAGAGTVESVAKGNADADADADEKVESEANAKQSESESESESDTDEAGAQDAIVVTPVAGASGEANSDPAAAASGAAPGRTRRPLWKSILIFSFKLFVLFPLSLVLYAVLGVIVFAGGVGWHYFDESAPLDVEEVSILAVGALVRDAHGEVVGRAGAPNRLLVEREDLPEHFVDALLAAEDQRFFLHRGFDPIGAVRAALTNYEAGYVKEGASTLTQQLARDAFDLKGKTNDRKLKEVAAAVRIETRFSKDEILVFYLNRIYFGSGFYGVGAAAKGYFNKPVGELSIDEGAMLCGLIRAPSRFSPLVSRERAIDSRNQTLRRMAAIDRLELARLDELLASETRIATTRDEVLRRGQTAYILSRVERELRGRLEIVPLRQEELAIDHYEVELSVDFARQLEVVRRIDRHLAEMEPLAADRLGRESEGNPLQAALVLLRSSTGEIVSLVGTHDFHRSEYDRAVEMKRPPGSALLPFLYAAAFESGQFAPESLLLDAPFDNREMGLGTIGGVLGEWSTEDPENRWLGELAASEALRLSKNSPSARLGHALGREAFGAFLVGCGVRSPLRDQPGSLLGTSEVSLSELALAYSAFANGGTPAPTPAMVRSLRDSQGNRIALKPQETPPPAMSAETARSIDAALRSADGGAVALKTGTTPTFTDAWCFGYDDEFTWGVWVGRDRFAPIHPMAFGRDLALPLAEALRLPPGGGVESADLGNDGGGEGGDAEEAPALANRERED